MAASDTRPWPWFTQKQALVEQYGRPLYRVPIDPGWSCPNRDEDGKGGCSFCAEHGSKAQQSLRAEGPEQQALRGMDFARERYGAEAFILYLQSYTATYTSSKTLKSLLSALLPLGPFRMLALGTRPDCLSHAVVEMLSRLNEEVDVSLELGVQSSHDPTLERINRGHDWACSRRAIIEMDKRGLRPMVHLILGLPGETAEDMLTTVSRVAALPIHGIKFHNLHILRGTQLAEEFAVSPFPLMDETDYAELLIECLRRTPAHVPVHRINTDTPDEELIAPRWVMKKGQFINRVARRMWQENCAQGDRCPA